MIQILILLIAAVLRIWGIDFGLPHLYHADEPVVVNHALYYGSGDFNPHFFNIPPLASYLLFIAYGFLFLSGKLAGWWASSWQFAEAFFRDPSIFYLLGRFLLGVFPGVLSIGLLMRWMRKAAVPKSWASLGGFLMAICFVHASDSHYIYADIPLVAVCILFFTALQTLDLKNRRNHFKLGLLIGLAAAFKYNGIFLALPYLWLVWRVQPKFARFIGSSLFAAAGAVCVVAVLNPYSILDFSYFMRELKEQNAANLGVPFLHHLTYSLAEGLGWPLILLGAAGSLRAFWGKDPRRESVALFGVIYFLVLWQKGQPYGRYVLPLVPGLIFLAVDAARTLFQKSWVLRGTVTLLLVGSIVGNGVKTLRFDWIMSQPDVRTEALNWIEKNIPAGSRIALDGTSFSPRLSFSCEQLTEKLHASKSRDGNFQSISQKRLQSKLRDCAARPGYFVYFMSEEPGENPFLFASPEIRTDLAELKRHEIDYVAVIFDERLKSALRQGAELVQVWDPYRIEGADFWKHDPQIITGGPFTLKDLMARRANGYRIELYRLKGSAAGSL